MNLRIFGSLLILSLIFTSGCLDLEFIYHTKINKNGSLIRKAQATGDSTDIYENPFPFVLDSSWVTSYSQTMRDTDSVYMVQVNRTFSNIEELNAIYSTLTDSSHTEPISVELDHSFRWFYTFSTWKERMPQQFPFSKIPVDSFLSKDELNFWLLSDTSILEKQSDLSQDELEKEIDRKLDDFSSRAIFEDFFEILLPIAKEKGIDGILVSKKKQLYDSLTKPLFDQSLDSIFIETDKFLGQALCEEGSAKSLFQSFSYKFDHMMDDLYTNESFTYFLECPGKIVGGNAVVDSNEIASWKFQGGNFFFHDYEMKLEYRMPNYWAFMVTAVVLLLLLWFIVRTGKRN
jgi:hypothetical protein